MKRQTLQYAILFAAILLTIVVLAGCSKPTRTGALNVNIPPRISWADVPIVHQYTRNPVIKYYSTDSDGLVLDYQYCILVHDTSTAWANETVANFLIQVES